MKKNIGSTDKIVRLLFAVVVIALYFTNVISGTLAIVLGILALTFTLTSSISFCPIYAMFGLSTRDKKEQQESKS